MDASVARCAHGTEEVKRWLVPLCAFLFLIAAAIMVFRDFQRQTAEVWQKVALHPEARELLEASANDQKSLARLDPAQEATRRERFETIQTLLQRLYILEESRHEVTRRYETVLLGLFVGTIFGTVALALWQRRRDEARLERLGTALGALAAGEADLDLGERSRDLIGRIAAMIEETSRRMARDQKRLKSLENLSAWQESARRHAHEMRTPLTGARLELERAESLLDGADPEETRRGLRGARQELERLARFTQAFTSFAKLPTPQLRVVDLGQLVQEFIATFAGAWPALELLPADATQDPGERKPLVMADRDMLRQVLVNLCDNAALALGEGRGTMSFVLGRGAGLVLLDLQDSGPGVAESVRERLFEPYSTTRKIGEGMGLGLAICRKILLDHGGDLELYRNGLPGACFRCSLPAAPEE